MKFSYLVFYSSTFLKAYYVQSHCIDIHSHIVSQGLHYVPGTNPCTLCICDKGSPKWCKSVLCSPPQNCKSFQVGSSCCEFKCLDDILSGHDTYKETYDVALRFIASTVTAVLSISLLFFLYNRLKRNKLLAAHNHQRENQRNLSNVGYITGNFGYLGGGSNELEIRYEETSTNFSLWKPPGDYMCGEAPPPYEEAMRNVQSELITNQINNTVHNTLMSSLSSPYPQGINPTVICSRREESTTSANNVPNISSNTHQYVNIRVHHNENRKQEFTHRKYDRDKQENSYENIKVLKAELNNRPTSSGCSSNIASSSNKYTYPKSKGIPRNHEMTIPQTKHLEFSHKITGKYSEPYEMQLRSIKTEQKKTIHRTLPKNLREILSNVEELESLKLQSSSFDTTAIFAKAANNVQKSENQPEAPETAERKDAQKSLMSYHSLSQDEEDYRSECENCKSVISGEEESEGINETMSLQRRPLSESGYELCYRTSLTLPTNTKKQRPYPAANNREKWFSSMQQSSSEESD